MHADISEEGQKANPPITRIDGSAHWFTVLPNRNNQRYQRQDRKAQDVGAHRLGQFLQEDLRHALREERCSAVHCFAKSAHPLVFFWRQWPVVEGFQVLVQLCAIRWSH